MSPRSTPRRIARRIALSACACALVGSAAQARDMLGVWNDWGAFRDPAIPRCYAIAMALPQPGSHRPSQPYATVATWPKRGIQGELHIHLSRPLAAGSPVALIIGSAKFALKPGGIDAWATDGRMDAAIIAAMRSGSEMTVLAKGSDGHTMRDAYRLAGVASAMDAASLGCANA